MGIPVWKANESATPLNPTEFGFTPEEASKLGGLVLVEPPTPPSKNWRYRYYQNGQNHCEEDLKKILADRAQHNVTGPEPYCTDKPTSPPTVRGNAFLF